MAPARARMTKTAIALRRQWGEVRLASAPDGYLRALFMEAEKTIQPRSRTAARWQVTCAPCMTAQLSRPSGRPRL